MIKSLPNFLKIHFCLPNFVKRKKKYQVDFRSKKFLNVFQHLRVQKPTFKPQTAEMNPLSSIIISLHINTLVGNPGPLNTGHLPKHLCKSTDQSINQLSCSLAHYVCDSSTTYHLKSQRKSQVSCMEICSK